MSTAKPLNPSDAHNYVKNGRRTYPMGGGGGYGYGRYGHRQHGLYPNGMDQYRKQDVAVGDEDPDITEADLEAYQHSYNQKYSFGRTVKVSYVVIGGLVGALIGTLCGSIAFQAADVDLRYVMWGLLIGAVFGCASIFAVLYLSYYMNSKFDKELNAKREALRRKEQSIIERHDEFVYYDGASEQGYFYRMLCCPHYGKITSERIIYSTDGERRGWYGYLTNCWSKQVEQTDYDMVMDVSVEQSCVQMCLGVGTVVLHCEASADVSMIKQERKRIVDALNSEDEKQLKSALLTAKGIKALEPLCKEAEALLKIVVKKRKEQCEKDGKEFKPIYVEASKRNSVEVLRVRDVSFPYSVMDDLSYRISKYTVLKGSEEMVQRMNREKKFAIGSGAVGGSEMEMAERKKK